jgi:uncharacterized protein YcaQ
VIELSLEEARRLAVLGQCLAEPRPANVLDVAQELGGLQLDPTSAVCRSELLVLWSRLGPYDLAELERLLWDERQLFEYWAYIVPTSDFAVHRETMRRHPRLDWSPTRSRYIRTWLEQNAAFRRYVLRELRRRGPLRSRDLEDRAAVPWRTGGWNDGKSLGRMLDILWFGGRIATAGRDGNERVWDLAERRLPVGEPRLGVAEVARRVLERQLRQRGVAPISQFGFVFDGRPAGWERALRQLVRSGTAVPARVEGTSGDWYAHADLLGLPFRPRTTLLSPFDKLISTRERTEQLFGFHYRLEIYVPKDKRRYGYYVLPILHGDRLIGRIDPSFDRKAAVLRVNAVYAEPSAPADAWPAVHSAIDDLAAWLGADRVTLPRLPRPWR